MPGSLPPLNVRQADLPVTVGKRDGWLTRTTGAGDPGAVLGNQFGTKYRKMQEARLHAAGCKLVIWRPIVFWKAASAIGRPHVGSPGFSSWECGNGEREPSKPNLGITSLSFLPKLGSKLEMEY